MATTGSGYPSSGAGEWGAGSSVSRDRRAAGRRDGFRQLARDAAVQRLGQQKNRASDRLDHLAGAVRNMTRHLEDEGESGLAGYITRAADQLEQWSSNLRRQDFDDMLRRLEGMARRDPALLVGIAFGAGLLAARFLKSTREEDYGSGESSRGWSDSPRGSTTTVGGAPFQTASGDEASRARDTFEGE